MLETKVNWPTDSSQLEEDLVSKLLADKPLGVDFLSWMIGAINMEYNKDGW